MYNSPIKTGLMYRELVKEVNKDTDEQIYKAVVACGVDVDRDELLRALRYDREQYDAGFAAGYRAATPKWIPVTERLPDLIPCDAGTAYSEAVVIWTDNRKAMVAVWDGVDFICPASFWEAEGENITHWMPLPSPPKEGE